MSEPDEKALWSRWGALTASLLSTRIAIERERALWEHLDLTNRDAARITSSTSGKRTIKITHHAAALEDQSTLAAAALVLSYCLHLGRRQGRIGWCR
jgi:hypothetical protein